MYHLTIAEAREFVRARLDELSVETSDMLSAEIDDANLDQTVEKLLEEAITFVHLAAPASLMEGQVITPSDFESGGVSVRSRVLEFDLGNLRAATPFKDCLRMVSFQCGDSDVKLTQAVYEDSPQARMQRNVYIQGQPDSPVLVQMDDSPDFRPHYRYYTTDRSLSDLNFSFRFFPRPSLVLDANAISASVSTSRFQANGGSGILTITTGGNWQIITDSLPSWINFASYVGTTDATTHKSTVSFSLSANVGGERNHVIYISNGVNTASCVITQSAASVGPTPSGPFLRVDSINLQNNILSVSPFSTAETVELRVYATKDLAVSGSLSDSTFFSVPQPSGVGKGSDYFSVLISPKQVNETQFPRQATLTFSAQGVPSVSIVLKQDVGLYVTPANTCVIPANGGNGNVTFTVKAGAPWTIVPNRLVTGIYPIINGVAIDQGPKGESTLAFGASQNTGGDRITDWTISCGYTAQDKILQVTQGSVAPSSLGLSVSPVSVDFEQNGESQTISVTAVGSDWSFSRVPTWLSAVRSGSSLVLTALDQQTHRDDSLTIFLVDDEEGNAIDIPVRMIPQVSPVELSLLISGLAYKNVPYSGGNFSAVLRSGGDWNLTTEGGFISITSATTGTGSDQDITVSFSISSTENARNGKIVVTSGGRTATLDIFQAARIDVLEVTDREQGGSHNYVEVQSSASTGWGFFVYSTRRWSASTEASWIHPNGSWTNIQSGSVPGFFNVERNAGQRRRGTITITQEGTGRTVQFDVYQLGEIPGGEFLDVSCNINSCDGRGYSGALISIRSDISWEVKSYSTGITFDGGVIPSGVGNKDVYFSIQASSMARTLEIVIGNDNYPDLTRTISIEQDGSSAYDTFGISPSGNKSVASTDTYVLINVISSISWTAAVTGAGASIDRSSGSGTKEIRVSFPANTSPSADKQYVVTVTPEAGKGFSAKTLTITQARAAGQYSLSVDQTTLSLGNSGAAQAVSLNSSHLWRATCSATWLIVSPTSGAAGSSQSVNISAKPNQGSRRGGTVRFYNDGASQEVSVSQAGEYADQSISVSPETLSFLMIGGTKTFKVFATGAWSLSGLDDNLTADKTSGTGNMTTGETVTLTTEENTGSPRSWELEVSLDDSDLDAAVLTVSQAEQESLTLSGLSSANVPNSGAYGTVDITSNTSWEWVPTDGVNVSVNASGTGNATARWFIGPNPSNLARTINLTFRTVSGSISRTVQISQPAGIFVARRKVGDASILSSISASAASASYTFFLWSNDAWEISSKPEWVGKVTPANGSGADAQQIDLLVLENIHEYQRSGNLIIRQKNTGATLSIIMTQDALAPTDDDIQVTSVGDTASRVFVGPVLSGNVSMSPSSGGSANSLHLSINSNCDWAIHDVTGSDVPLQTPFMTFDVNSGTSGVSSVTITLAQNTGENPRTLRGVVMNDDGSVKEFFWIVQRGTASSIDVSPANRFLLFTADSLSYTIEVLSASGWRVEIEYDDATAQWLNVSPVQGNPNSRIPVTIARNDQAGNIQYRSATITITNDEDSVQIFCSAEPDSRPSSN